MITLKFGWVFWICKFVSFTNIQIFSHYHFTQFLSITFFFFYSGTLITLLLDFSVLSHNTQMSSHFTFFFFRVDNLYCPVFRFTKSFLLSPIWYRMLSVNILFQLLYFSVLKFFISFFYSFYFSGKTFYLSINYQGSFLLLGYISYFRVFFW